MSEILRPSRGMIFWPVGSGDSTTIVIDEETIVQVDIRHMAKADDDDEPHLPVLDELIKLLPKKNGKPYLALFVLTHPDKDHCQGFEELLKRVHIGELWFSPNVFTEFKSELCDDAVSFQIEAKRRLKATVKANGTPSSGDRIRVIGYDEEVQGEEYKGFPKEMISIPGHWKHRFGTGRKSPVYREQRV
jgi:beta-lactamase superfamily II metal-dependent hydrolase